MPADIATLLAEAPWLARLARSLTGDAAEADDIVQETYAAALRSPPETDRPLRPWLRRVAVNLARMRHRGRTRREATEEVVETQVSSVRTPDELLERAQLERRLAELVIALDEPFRSTVLLRYREGLTAEQIAKQQGIPAGTVRTRLKTGLDRLRREIDDGERSKLRAMFAPLAAAGSSATTWRFVMAKVTSKAGVALLLLLLLLGGGALVLRHRGSAAPQETGEHVTPAKTGNVASPEKFATMFVQPGVAARQLRGRVTADGAPYRGASVRLFHAETGTLLGDVATGADGTFDFGNRAADVYVVSASAQGRTAVPERVDLRVPATPEVELRLLGCSYLRGTVVDGSGSPIDHARIARDDAPMPFAETDATGHYELCTHFGTATFRYAASGYQSVLVSFPVVANTTSDVVLAPEATLEGTVLTEDGAPVPGAWVVADPSQPGSPRDAPATAFSDGTGAFRITAVSPGRNLIAAFAPGLRSTHRQEVVTGAGQVTTGIIVRLARTTTITGGVVRGGTPVPGVGVGLRIGQRDEPRVLAITQADGTFTIDRAPRGDVAFDVQNHAVLAPRSIHIEGSMKVQIEVEPMGSVQGRVLLGGQPVAGAQVTCPRERKLTDSSGTYRCSDVDAGDQEIYADAPHGEWGLAKVTVRRGETATLDIPLTYVARICGRVVDESGSPLTGLLVQAAEQTTGDFGKATTAADGAFCMQQLTGGVYDVAVYAGPRLAEPVEPLAAITVGPTETKTVTLAVKAPQLAIAGSVLDLQGAPVVDALVRIVAADRVGVPNLGGRVPGSLAVADEAGRFELSRLVAGDYTLIATARDGSQVRTAPVAAGARDVVITVAPAGRIEGQLVGFASVPTITGLLVTDTHRLIEVDVDGAQFRATGLSPGTYVLMAVAESRDADTREAIVRAGETTKVTLTNRGTATVIGTVRDFKTRKPVTGLRCTSAARDGTSIGAVFAGRDEAVATDEHGAFRLVSPAGEINVLCLGPTATAARLAVAPRDRTTTIEMLAVADTRQASTIDAELEFLSHRIRELVKSGAADRAGLAVGDEIVAVDGASIVELGSDEVLRLITQRPAGTTARLTILRGAEQRDVTVAVRSAS